ncbi:MULTISPECIES: class I SAM-dependent methyltransferase [unclassified Rhizobium]|uniref:class I SAM-dependent methyltransferase n=1 Tax=unclassified Rhizobium TaxID=2613769 RepID=UPI0007005E97|nr:MULTISPECIES: class I SAM-dependent methyltransferase [unclassified Rhizobium]KQV43340.1 SAM-dependent methyltransferase [Rhizobium sp. Root1212]KRD37525.1 SAM-dependent methyltransferase [Rhizobium sp. Root268]
MTSSDEKTLNFYASEAQVYASRPRAVARGLDGFLSRLPTSAKILELGCGGGQDSLAMLERGFDVIPTDGSPEMTAAAEHLLDRPVAVLPFDQLDDVECFDGIWANACLLHVPRTELSAALSRIHRALKPAGIFYASFKAGDSEGRDRFGRYFNYPTADWLRLQYEESGWPSPAIEQREGGGYDGEETLWLGVTVVKTG